MSITFLTNKDKEELVANIGQLSEEFAAKMAEEVYSKAETDEAIDAAKAEEKVEVIRNFVAEDTATLLIDADNEEKPFELTCAYLYIACGGDVEVGSYKNGYIYFGTANNEYYAKMYNTGTWTYPGYQMTGGKYRTSSIKAICYFAHGLTRFEGIYGDEGGATTNRFAVYVGDYLNPITPDDAITRVTVTIEVPKNAVVTLYGVRKVKT